MPSPLVDKGHSAFRKWFRKVWDVRGGGLYACGFALTFIILELGSLREDVAGAGELFSGGIIAFAISFFLDFLIDSLVNTITALMWPIYVIQWAPPWGAVGLGLAYWLFPSYLKEPIEKWMFNGEPPEDAAAELERKADDVKS